MCRLWMRSSFRKWLRPSPASAAKAALRMVRNGRAEARPSEADARSSEADARSFEVDSRPFEAESRPFGVEARSLEIEVRPFEAKARPFGVEALKRDGLQLVMPGRCRGTACRALS